MIKKSEEKPEEKSEDSPKLADAVGPKDETKDSGMAELKAKRERILEGKEKAPAPPEEKRGRGRPKGSTKEKELTKQIDEEAVKGWQVTTALFTMVVAGLISLIWPKKELNADEKNAHTRAWAIYLSVCPPDDLEGYAKLQIGIVYAAILVPRIGSTVIEKMRSRREQQALGLLAHPPEEEEKKDEQQGQDSVV